MAYKIGIDFHGVINSNPLFFRDFIDYALAQNIEVHIISGGPKETITRYLEENNIRYSVLWCIYDYYENSGQVTYFSDGSFHIQDDLWNLAKADYCKQQGICIHVDDSTIYRSKFTTPYCLYNEQDKTCAVNGETIDFSEHPQDALNKLLSYCKN